MRLSIQGIEVEVGREPVPARAYQPVCSPAQFLLHGACEIELEFN
jgi:hypothetical protein